MITNNEFDLLIRNDNKIVSVFLKINATEKICVVCGKLSLGGEDRHRVITVNPPVFNCKFALSFGGEDIESVVTSHRLGLEITLK